MATSQNGYAASADRASLGIKTFQVPGRPDVKVPLRSDVAPLFLEFYRWWNANIEPLVVPGCWGYAFRAIRGASRLSNHASGTAGDVNAPRHPLGARGTVPAHKRAAISAKCRSLGLRWGGDYTGRADEMHFELNVPLTRARELVRALQAPPKRPAPGTPAKPAPGKPAPGKPAGRATLRQGSTGQAVRDLQTHLKRTYPAYAGHLAVDGSFGPATTAVVREFQRRTGLPADGVVGPTTWAKVRL